MATGRTNVCSGGINKDDLGTATADDVVSPKTVLTPTGLQEGTIVTRNAEDKYITKNSTTLTILPGYYKDANTVSTAISNLSASNIRSGKNVGGTIGSYSGRTTGTITLSRSGGKVEGSRTISTTSVTSGFLFLDGTVTADNYNIGLKKVCVKLGENAIIERIGTSSELRIRFYLAGSTLNVTIDNNFIGDAFSSGGFTGTCRYELFYS